MGATFSKLKSGEYGIRADGTLRVGEVVTVTKRGGSTSRVVVAKILWTGADRETGRTVTLAAIEQSGGRGGSSGGSSGRRGYGASRRGRSCPHCGGNESNQVECSHCA